MLPKAAVYEKQEGEGCYKGLVLWKGGFDGRDYGRRMGCSPKQLCVRSDRAMAATRDLMRGDCENVKTDNRQMCARRAAERWVKSKCSRSTRVMGHVREELLRATVYKGELPGLLYMDSGEE